MKQISKTEFTVDVTSGKTRKELMTKYELSLTNIKAIAKELNLEIKRDFKPKFVLVDDIPTNQLNMDKELVFENLN